MPQSRGTSQNYGSVKEEEVAVEKVEEVPVQAAPAAVAQVVDLPAQEVQAQGMTILHP